MHYGERAKEWITDHDVTQKSLAKEFDVTEANMSHYMTGHTPIPVDILVKFAKKFDLSTDYLLGLSDEPHISMQLSEEERQIIKDLRTLRSKQKELIIKNIAIMQEQNRRE